MDDIYRVWIFSDIELNLCVRILGYPEWYLIKIGDDGKSLEKRMMEGFFSLLEKKLIYVENGRFLLSEQMYLLIIPLVKPDNVIEGEGSKSDIIYFRKKGKGLIGVEKMNIERGYYRLYYLPENYNNIENMVIEK